MSERQSLRFDDLDLKFGQVIQLHPSVENGTERYDCILVGCLPGEAVIITAPEDGRFPLLEAGGRVVIRVMSCNGVALFPTTILHVGESPVYLVYLDFPKSIQFKLVRNASRVDVALPILVSNIQKKALRGIVGRIVDISLSGAQLNVDDNIGEMGDRLELKGKFEVSSIKRTLGIQAVIKAKHCNAEGAYAYGVEFHEKDEDKLLVLFGYIFNAMALGQPKKIQ